MTRTGGRLSEETRHKISEAKKGEKNAIFGKHHSEETRRKISENHADFSGEKNPSFGKHPSEEARHKMSEAHRGKYFSEETRCKMSDVCRCSPSEETRRKMSEARRGEKNPNFGKCHSEEARRKMSEAQRGEKSRFWKGGISFEPYCQKFNRAFKERVRAFFGRVCVECGKSETGAALSVHHVNYDKMVCCNGVKPLFVALCRSHNAKANNNRPYWEQYYTAIINEKYGGACYQPAGGDNNGK